MMDVEQMRKRIKDLEELAGRIAEEGWDHPDPYENNCKYCGRFMASKYGERHSNTCLLLEAQKLMSEKGE